MNAPTKARETKTNQMSAPEEQPEAPERTLTVNVVKSGAFRLVHADSFYVQTSPMGGTRLTALSDRISFVNQFVHAITNDVIGKPINEPPPNNTIIEREIQVEIAMSDRQALALFQNLQDYLHSRGILKQEPE